MIENTTNNPTALSHMYWKQQEHHTKQVFFQEKGSNYRNVEQDILLSGGFVFFF